MPNLVGDNLIVGILHDKADLGSLFLYADFIKGNAAE